LVGAPGQLAEPRPLQSFSLAAPAAETGTLS